MEALETLGVDFRVIFVQIVGFLILYWVLNKFLFSRVRGILVERKDEIKTGYDRNEAERQEIARLKEEYEKRMAGIKLEADRVIEEGNKKAEAIRQEAIAQAEKDSKDILEKSKRDIQAEKERAVSDAHDQIADLSLTVASKLINRSLSGKDHLQFVDECLSKIGPL